MAKSFRIPFFGGMVPRAGRRVLQDNQAQIATNTRLTSGELAALFAPVLRNNTVVANVRSVYKLVQAGADYWLGWTTDVDAAKGPIAGDVTNRTYFTGESYEPRVTDFALATTSSPPYPVAWYVLGVTPPVTAASLTHAGGTGTAVSRAFVYTFVTQWGEESQPSSATAIVVGKTDGTWTLGATTAMDVAPLNTYSITAASWAAGTLTLTVGSTFGLRAGEYVTLSGLAPSVLNASWKVATASGTTITITMADPGAITDQVGTATRNAPHNTTSMTKNIYWTESTVSGTQYQLVKSGVAVADTSTTVAGNVTPGEEIPTTDWEMPPVDLKGMMFHSSGAAVGFTKNQLCFSEPYAPYAWPLINRFTVDYGVVGIGIYGNTVVVATEGKPFIASGVDPETVTLSQIDEPWPCLAKPGVVSMGFGVLYPAPQGLALIGAQGVALVTKTLYTQKEWLDLEPSTFRSAAHSDRYVASHDPQGSGLRKLLIVDPSEFASVTTATENCFALYGDQRTGTLYVVKSDDIYEWDSSEGLLLTYDWMSKEVRDAVFNPAAAKVDADFTQTLEEITALAAAAAAAAAANQALINAGTYDTEGSMSAVGEIEVGGVSYDEVGGAVYNQLQFQLWVDNLEVYTKILTESGSFVLPPGFKGQPIAVRLAGNVKVVEVVVADSMLGLRAA